MMVGIKYHLHHLRRLLAWKNDKRKLSNPPNYNFVHYLIAFNIFDKLLYYSSRALSSLDELSYCSNRINKEHLPEKKIKHKKNNS